MLFTSRHHGPSSEPRAKVEAYGAIFQDYYQRRSKRDVDDEDPLPTARSLCSRYFGAMNHSSLTGAEPAQDPQLVDGLLDALHDMAGSPSVRLGFHSTIGKEALNA